MPDQSKVIALRDLLLGQTQEQLKQWKFDAASQLATLGPLRFRKDTADADAGEHRFYLHHHSVQLLEIPIGHAAANALYNALETVHTALADAKVDAHLDQAIRELQARGIGA